MIDAFGLRDRGTLGWEPLDGGSSVMVGDLSVLGTSMLCCGAGVFGFDPFSSATFTSFSTDQEPPRKATTEAGL